MGFALQSFSPPKDPVFFQSRYSRAVYQQILPVKNLEGSVDPTSELSSLWEAALAKSVVYAPLGTVTLLDFPTFEAYSLQSLEALSGPFLFGAFTTKWQTPPSSQHLRVFLVEESIDFAKSTSPSGVSSLLRFPKH
jgi:hypothetical protein